MSEQAKRINACVGALPMLEQEQLESHYAVADVEGETRHELARDACLQGAEAVVGLRREEISSYTIYTPIIIYTGTAVSRQRRKWPVATTRQPSDASGSPSPAAPIGPMRKLSDLRRGAEVRVRAPDIFRGKRTGELLAIYNSQIEVRIGRSRTKIPLFAIESLETKRVPIFGLTTTLSAGIGSIAGSLIGFFVAPWLSRRTTCSGISCEDPDPGSSARFGAVTGSILGLVAGMAVGKRLREDHWEPVALPALDGP